jgi:hypothetical protein
VCRQSIVFEDPGDVAACLSAIAADSDVQVVYEVGRQHLAFKVLL